MKGEERRNSTALANWVRQQMGQKSLEDRTLTGLHCEQFLIDIFSFRIYSYLLQSKIVHFLYSICFNYSTYLSI